MHEISSHYRDQVADGFRQHVRAIQVTHIEARDRLDPFVTWLYPVLRHYRPEIVGQCLAVAYDDPGSYRSKDAGFGLLMLAGNHRLDRDGALGSYRDDGSYLALQARDYFAGAL